MAAKKKKKKGNAAALEVSPCASWAWELPRQGKMRVPGRIFADASLMRQMDALVLTQLANVACLPGIVEAAFAMPDAHSGYGFPIGGVAAFSSERGGVVSAGGVGFDIACGVRTLVTNLAAKDVRKRHKELADTLFKRIPAGLGVHAREELSMKELEAMLMLGARWAVDAGQGEARDLEYCEERGVMPGAEPDQVSEIAKKRQLGEMGTLGSGNHYLEVQEVDEVFDTQAAQAFGLEKGLAVCSIHCGSRGLGHQIGTDYLARMTAEASRHGLELADRELACAPLDSKLGRCYLGAMRAGVNCALANRQVLTHQARLAFMEIFPESRLQLLYDVSHNTCKEELHMVGGKKMRLFVHRKGATRAFGPGHPDLPPAFAAVGQPVLVGGSMGTRSFILAGAGAKEAFASANHGAGRNLSRSQARKQFQGRDVVAGLARKGIQLRVANYRGAAEEAPGAYKDIEAVVSVTQEAGFARKVAALTPLLCVKG